MIKKKIELAIVEMPRATIVEVANLAREIEEEMPTPHKSKRSQLLSNNKDSDEELTNDE